MGRGRVPPDGSRAGRDGAAEPPLVLLQVGEEAAELAGWHLGAVGSQDPVHGAERERDAVVRIDAIEKAEGLHFAHGADHAVGRAWRGVHSHVVGRDTSESLGQHLPAVLGSRGMRRRRARAGGGIVVVVARSDGEPRWDHLGRGRILDRCAGHAGGLDPLDAGINLTAIDLHDGLLAEVGPPRTSIGARHPHRAFPTRRLCSTAPPACPASPSRGR